jgi:hypothetical protein
VFHKFQKFKYIFLLNILFFPRANYSHGYNQILKIRYTKTEDQAGGHYPARKYTGSIKQTQNYKRFRHYHKTIVT